MRTLYLLITISLLVLLHAAVNSAELAGESCHGQKTTANPMEMEKCCCSSGLELSAGHMESFDRFSGVGCCPPESCRMNFAPEKKSLLPNSHVDYTFSAFLTDAMIQPDLSLRAATDHLEIPLTRAPSSPIYLQYCSLLI